MSGIGVWRMGNGGSSTIWWFCPCGVRPTKGRFMQMLHERSLHVSLSKRVSLPATDIR